jgi:hypothetical protein
MKMKNEAMRGREKSNEREDVPPDTAVSRVMRGPSFAIGVWFRGGKHQALSLRFRVEGCEKE